LLNAIITDNVQVKDISQYTLGNFIIVLYIVTKKNSLFSLFEPIYIFLLIRTLAIK